MNNTILKPLTQYYLTQRITFYNQLYYNVSFSKQRINIPGTNDLYQR